MLQMISIFFASGLHFKLITFSLVTTKLYFMQFFINRDWSDHQNHYEYSYAILLHVQGIPNPAHFRYGRGEYARQLHSKIIVLCLTLGVRHSRVEVCCG